MNKIDLDNNNYHIYLRHGHALHNTQQVYNSNPEHPDYFESDLTVEGIQQVQQSAKELLDLGFSSHHFSKVFVSPLPRTIQTASILSQNLLIHEDICVLEPVITELQVGHLEGKELTDYDEHLSLADNINDYESYEDLKKRLSSFLKTLQKENGNVLIISHKCILETLILLHHEKEVAIPTGAYHIETHKKRR
ncbi:MAG: hypothetical protein GWP59_06960 [Chlamydiales bacterium]|nr:phosphoglycerate mutase family protein [Chlamydiales bacterium]NCF71423.1 hypothetical protein [Chlamydiales bacterium]